MSQSTRPELDKTAALKCGQATEGQVLVCCRLLPLYWLQGGIEAPIPRCRQSSTCMMKGCASRETLEQPRVSTARNPPQVFQQGGPSGALAGVPTLHLQLALWDFNHPARRDNTRAGNSQPCDWPSG